MWMSNSDKVVAKVMAWSRLARKSDCQRRRKHSSAVYLSRASLAVVLGLNISKIFNTPLQNDKRYIIFLIALLFAYVVRVRFWEVSGSVSSCQRGERVDVASLTNNLRGSFSPASNRFGISLGFLDRVASGTSCPLTWAFWFVRFY